MHVKSFCMLRYCENVCEQSTSNVFGKGWWEFIPLIERKKSEVQRDKKFASLSSRQQASIRIFTVCLSHSLNPNHKLWCKLPFRLVAPYAKLGLQHLLCGCSTLRPLHQAVDNANMAAVDYYIFLDLSFSPVVSFVAHETKDRLDILLLHDNKNPCYNF